MKCGIIVACAAVACAGIGTSALGQIVSLDFEDLTPDPQGSPYTYNLGSVFSSGGATLTVDPFFFFPSGTAAPSTTFTGVEADNTLVPTTAINFAGRTGNALGMNNMSVDIGVSSVTTIGFHFGDYGGNVNMMVNGSLFNAIDLSTLPASLGGASVTYTSLGAAGGGTTGALGRVDITGTISQFSVGGQEFWIDDVRIVIPTPGSAGLMALGGLVAIRRKR